VYRVEVIELLKV